MADSIHKVSYFKAMAPNKAGEGARLLGALKDSGVNLLAFSGFPAGKKAQMDFIPENSSAFLQAAKSAGIKVGAGKTVFLVQGDDRTGALAEILSRLAQAKVSVIALDGVSAGLGRYGAIFWVKPKDVAKAANVLGAI